jgi:hypothetical protein
LQDRASGQREISQAFWPNLQTCEDWRISISLPSITTGVIEQTTEDTLPNLWIFQVGNFSILLPIIFSIHKAKIRGSYHNISIMVRSRDTMALSLISEVTQTPQYIGKKKAGPLLTLLIHT